MMPPGAAAMAEQAGCRRRPLAAQAGAGTAPPISSSLLLFLLFLCFSWLRLGGREVPLIQAVAGEKLPGLTTRRWAAPLSPLAGGSAEKSKGGRGGG